MILIGGKSTRGKTMDLESHDLGKNPARVGHEPFGSGCSKGLAWEIEDLIPAMSTSLLQADSNE